MGTRQNIVGVKPDMQAHMALESNNGATMRSKPNALISPNRLEGPNENRDHDLVDLPSSKLVPLRLTKEDFLHQHALLENDNIVMTRAHETTCLSLDQASTIRADDRLAHESSSRTTDFILVKARHQANALHLTPVRDQGVTLHVTGLQCLSSREK